MLEETKETKKCSGCGDVKPLGEYYTNGATSTGKQRYASRCISCSRIRSEQKRRLKGAKQPNYVIDGKKKCTRCGEVKSTDSFHKKLSGYASRCKDCTKQVETERRRAKGVAVGTFNYIIDGKKKCTRCGEVKPVFEFGVSDKNRGTIKGYCLLCAREENRKYNKTDRGKIVNRNRSRRNKVIRAGIAYSTNLTDEYLITKELVNNQCVYCGVDLTTVTENMEHIIPVSIGGTHTPNNTMPSCQHCNYSKNARPMEEWYREQPFFSEERLQQIYAIRDYWNAVGFEVVYPTQDQIVEAHAVAEDAIETIQSISRLQRDPEYIQQYI